MNSSPRKLQHTSLAVGELFVPAYASLEEHQQSTSTPAAQARSRACAHFPCSGAASDRSCVGVGSSPSGASSTFLTSQAEKRKSWLPLRSALALALTFSLGCSSLFALACSCTPVPRDAPSRAPPDR